MKKINASLIYILAVHVLALLLMSLHRMVLLLTNLPQIETVQSKFSWILSAFVRGVWFDNVIACYIVALPLVLMLLLGLFNVLSKPLLRGFNVFFTITYGIVFGVGVADVPYFNYFFRHLNASIFNWAEEKGTAVNMIFQEKSYYVYFLFFVASVVLFAWLVIRLRRFLLARELKKIPGREYFLYVPLSLLLLGLCTLGIRGRLGYNPIKSSQAYFCDNSFLNELGINPMYYFIRDVIEASESHYSVDKLITESEAVALARREYGMEGNAPGKFPMARMEVATGKPRKMNVVVVLMESMSADLLKIEENGKPITPYLHELIGKSYYFENFYSAGNHTNHGVLASLFGIPAMFDKNIMKNVDIPRCQGLPSVLQQNGYQTMFFMSHESQYDNMNAFLTENGVKEIYAEENYPPAEKVNSFGVADDFLLQYALKRMNEKAADGTPFQSTVLTISNHPPYIVPEEFKAVSDDPTFQIVAYADNALRQFMQNAEKQPWFENTVFVFLGDHGKMVGANSYELPLSYNHVPLIIYSKAFADAPRRLEQLGGQVDVFPTIMGLLNLSYENNTFGVDLFKTDRPYMFFSADNGFACIDKEYFYAYNFKSQMEGLYQYKSASPANVANMHKDKAHRMKRVSAAMLQTANYLIKHRLIRAN